LRAERRAGQSGTGAERREKLGRGVVRAGRRLGRRGERSGRQVWAEKRKRGGPD
jgi:hypothetical protein